MGIDLNFLNPLAPVMDIAGGIVSANQARSAFKSRYQDTVRDMRKAGLNPALAYGQGGGNPSTVPLPHAGESLSKAVQTSTNAKQSRANQELTEAQTNLLRAQTAELSKRPFLENQNLIAQGGLMGAQTTNTQAQTDNTRMRTIGENLENTNRQVRNDIAVIDRSLRQLDKDYQTATYADRVKLVAKAVEQAGLNISATDIANYLGNAKKPVADLTAEGASSAQDFKKTWGQWMESLNAGLEDASDAVKNWYHKQMRQRARAGIK